MGKSLDILNRELEKTLRAGDTAPKVFCIRGPWGVGKTFAWDQFLLTNKDLLPLNTYSYVSLFGLESLGQLKTAVSENTISKEMIGQKYNLKTVIENQKSSLLSFAKRQGKNAARFMNRSGAVEVIDSWAFSLVNNQLICFDDIERRGDKLRLADFLGLVSDLVERRKCRVVIILNDEELLPDDKKVLNAYQEKVIDVSIQYVPTAEECADVALKKDEIGREISKRSILLGITNIRILKKTVRLAEDATPMVKGFHKNVSKQLIDTLILFGWAHYSKRDDVIEFALKKRGRGLYGTNREKISEEEKGVDDLLDKYGFAVSDDFDRLLLEAIKAGYFDETAVIIEASKLNERQKKKEANVDLDDAWRKYHDSLDANEDEVASGIIRAFYANVDSIAPQNFAGTVWLMKNLGRSDESSKMMNAYFAVKRDRRSYYDLDDHPFGGDITDPEIIDAFKRAYDAFVDDRDPLELIMGFFEDKGMNIDDWSQAATVEIDDLRQCFKSLEGYSLRRAINSIMVLANHAPPQKTVYDKAVAALKLIAGESRINRLRLERYKIAP